MEWNGDGCKPLTVSEYLEPQLHPDKEYRAIVKSTRSFSDLLAPRIDLQNGLIGLADLNSTGRLFEVVCSSTEARSPEDIELLHKKVTEAISNSISELSNGPWIAQWFVQDENDSIVRELTRQVIRYTHKSIRETEYTTDWFRRIGEHLKDMTEKGGLFRDLGLVGKQWRGRNRRIRLCIWRNLPASNSTGDETIDQVCEQLESALAQAEVKLIAQGAEELYEWLTQWFVPKPPTHTGYGDTSELLQASPWNPSRQERSMSLFSNNARSDISRASMHGTVPWTWKRPGIWWFCGNPSRFVTLDELTVEPEIGHLTGERKFGDSIGTLWDRMPENSIWSMSVVFSPQEQIEKKIRRVRTNSVGDDPAASERRNLANTALMEITRSNPVYRVYSGVFLSSASLTELNRNTERVLSLMHANGLRPIPPRHDPIALDSYIRALPFGFDIEQDNRPFARRSRLWFSSHISRMLPVYGRSTGTGFPGCILFNRGAEPLVFDPLNPTDRQKNAHSLILGPTGSGKTALLIYFLLHLTAVHRPRIVLLSALPTFGLFAAHCKEMGLSVHQVRIDGSSRVSLPPFKFAQTLLDSENGGSEKPDSFHRDPLGEMEIQARLMITGGQENEESRLRRDDLDLIRVALKQAAKRSLSDGRTQTMTSDLMQTFLDAAKTGTIDDRTLSQHQKSRSARMASAINVFCTGLNGELFDREGDLWPSSDITVIELDILARRGYEDRLAVALTGLFSTINNEIEANQYTQRQTIVVIDEAHILLQNPLISPYINRISAMWRTFGAWLWIATQNIRQFPDNAKELLNQPEWWYCLSLDRDEIDQIARFKSLTSQQKDLLLAARKSPGLFTEGTIISARLLSLFRNTPPALALALSQTEKSEKAERQRIMDQESVSELEAAYLIADSIRTNRSKKSEL
ncbi:MAG: conjugative transfer ATPase [Acidiferrobacterales bacterium]|nr:conjugative transfer ATPase [Acidiferrobacterales bacterium]